MSHPKNFFILIGAPKSGTTSIANWMKNWPGFHLQSHGKEPRFFTDFHDKNWSGPGIDQYLSTKISDEATYLSGFPGAPEDWAIDGSTDYLWCDASPELIKAWSRRFNVKLACILRDPIDRIISEYQHTIRDHLQSDSLRKSVELENMRFEESWQPLFYHTRRSRYLEKVDQYRDLFGDNFLTMGYHELKDPQALADKLSRFLGVEGTAAVDPSRKNASHSYRFAPVGKMIKNKNVQKLARRIVPRSLRAPIRGAVTKLNQIQFQASENDKTYLRSLLSDEIAACRDAPHIPTDGWITAYETGT